MTNRTLKLTVTAVAAWLALAAWYAPAFALDTSPLHATLPQTAFGVREAQPDNSPPAEGASSLPQHPCGVIPIPIQFALVLAAPVVLPSSPAFAQNSPDPHDEKRSEKERPISYREEIDLSSGYADRGLVISHRPVVQSVTWVSGSVGTFSVWSNVTLAETTDGSRPQILDVQLTRAHEWENLTIGPAIETCLYRDPLSIDRCRSIEGCLYLSYHAGPFRLLTNHSVDVLAYKGAYFGEAGIAFDRHGSQRVGWLAAYVKPHLDVGPHFQFSTIVDRAVRAELAQPTVFYVGLATGVEF